MTEIATLYLALHRGVVVADVLFNRGEKKAKRTQAGLPLEAFLESVEKNCYPLFLSELKAVRMELCDFRFHSRSVIYVF